MDLQHLENFLVIVEQGSVSHAARIIRITQPALTRQLQALEAQFGAPLLARNRRGVVLTPAGEALVVEARRILNCVQQAHGAVDAVTRRPGGRLSLGVAASIARLILPAVALAARKAMPEARLELTEGYSDSLCERLVTNRLDMAVIHQRQPMPGTEARVLFSEAIVAVGAPGIFQPGEAVSMKDLLRHEAVVTAQSGRLRLLYEEVVAKSGRVAGSFLEMDSFPALIELLAAGGGVSLLPYSAIHHEVAAKRLSWAQIGPRQLRRSVVLVQPVGRIRTPAREEMEAIIDDFVRRNAASYQWHLPNPTPT